MRNLIHVMNYRYDIFSRVPIKFLNKIFKTTHTSGNPQNCTGIMVCELKQLKKTK